MASESSIHFDIEESKEANHPPQTVIKCHGKLTSGNSKEIKDLVKPLIEAGGREIVIDCGDLQSVDSSGLGTLVGLKVSAIRKGQVKLKLVNLSPRVAELLKLTNLGDLLTIEYR
jgi:anti-sigma B factor antagonist